MRFTEVIRPSIFLLTYVHSAQSGDDVIAARSTGTPSPLRVICLINRSSPLSKTNQPTDMKLFSPVQLGAIGLSHRVIHGPTTRLRANPDDSPSEMMVEYYRQRASKGGLIIIEASNVSMQARGYLGAPSLFEDGQIGGFRKIAQAVHAKGGKVIAQIVHCGRTAHVDLTGGRAPIGRRTRRCSGSAQDIQRTDRRRRRFCA
jgi:NADH:flavin oxidoreductase / NADH oxidase family